MKASTTVKTAQTGTLENRRQFFSHAGIVMFGALTAGTMVGSREALAAGCGVSAWAKMGTGAIIAVSGGFVFTQPVIGPVIGIAILGYGVLGPFNDGLKECNVTLLDRVASMVKEFGVKKK